MAAEGYPKFTRPEPEPGGSVTTRMTDEELAAVKRLAAARGLTVSDLVRESLDAFVAARAGSPEPVAGQGGESSPSVVRHNRLDVYFLDREEAALRSIAARLGLGSGSALIREALAAAVAAAGVKEPKAKARRRKSG
jgi:hypothetical protein